MSTLSDGTIAKSENILLSSPNPLKLAIFGANVSSGCSMTSAEGTIDVEWDESVRIAQAAERAGFEAMIPVARWKGMKGDVNFNHRSFDTLTWAAGLAAQTSKIGLLATTHVPTIHPIRVAKTCATIDHIAKGRFGLNIVAGWNPKEINMFGTAQRDHDERYDVADEWISLVKRLWTEESEFDWNGKYFNIEGAYSSPRPIQDGGPVIMNAGLSPRGQEFAISHADMIFIAQPDHETTTKTVLDLRERAAKAGRSISIFWEAYVVCADTEKEAKQYRDYYIHEKGDWVGVRNLLDDLIPNSQSVLGSQWESMAENMIGGYAGSPLVGTPEQIVEGLLAMKKTGIDGTTLSWVKYVEGIDQYREQILPLAIEAGVRVA